MPENIIPEAGEGADREPATSADQSGNHPVAITQEQYLQKYCEGHNLPAEYWAAGKAGKTDILDRAVDALGVHRKSLIRRFGQSRGELQLSAGAPGRPRVYSEAARESLIVIWEILDAPGERQLVGSLPLWLEANQQFRELDIPPEVMADLLQMSSATAGRIVKARRNELRAQSAPRMKPHSQIQRETALRTWSDWDDMQPGEVQVDTVFHAGGRGGGGHLYTLTAHDPFSGWTTAEAIRSLTRDDVMRALDRRLKACPFFWTAMHTDNGSEFLNEYAVNWCKKNNIHRTRGRPGKSNDQAYVENANRVFVRRLVGDLRYEGEETMGALNDIYEVASDLTNIFRATIRLIEKERHGPRVTRRYDEARTPLDRLVAAGAIEVDVRGRIERRIENLNPFELRRKRERLLERLWELGRHTR